MGMVFLAEVIANGVEPMEYAMPRQRAMPRAYLSAPVLACCYQFEFATFLYLIDPENSSSTEEEALSFCHVTERTPAGAACH